MPSSRESSQKKSKSRSRSRRKEERPRERYDRNERVEKAAKLFVTNIDSKNTEDQIKADLTKEFQRFGEIKQIIVKTKPGSDNSFAFIEFKTIEQAEKALQSMKGKQFKGKQLKVEYGKGGRKQKQRNHHSCYICHRSGHFANSCPMNRNLDRRGSDRYRRRSRSSSRDHYRRRYDRYDRRSRSRSGGQRYRRDRPRKKYSGSRSNSRGNDRRRSRSRSDNQRNY